VLAQLLRAAPIEHPDPEELTREILSRLRREGLIDEPTQPPLVAVQYWDVR
jgi:hypothetical protein